MYATNTPFLPFKAKVGLPLLVISLAGCNTPEKKPREEIKPNIVFFFADQLRNQSVGYNGESNITTPNIDQLASEGVVFSNAVSTCPISGPYRGMLQTGRYPTNSGLLVNWIDPDTTQKGIASLFADEGYETGFIGKWHLNSGYLKNFGIDYDSNSTMHGEKMAGFNDPGNHSEFVPPGPYRLGYTYWAAYNFHTNFAENCYYYEDTPEKKYFEPYEVDGEISVAIDFMKKCKAQEKPFMAMIAPHTPHNPWKPEDVPTEYLEQVKDELVKRKNVKGTLIPEEHIDDWDARVYYAMIKNIDYNIGRLMDFLKESGLIENTIVVFTSDHGEMLGSQGRTYKMVPYAESVDIPLIYYWKNKTRGGTSSNSIYTPIDHMPTLLSLAGIKPPSFADGIDLSHAVLGKSGQDREEALMMLYSSHWDYCLTLEPWKEWRAVKTKTHTYIKWIDGKEELYNNIDDPYQMTNLAENHQNEVIITKLRNTLTRLLKNSNDTFQPGTAYKNWFNDNRQVVYHEEMNR